MADDVTYYNQVLWQHTDSQISTNNFSLDKLLVDNSWNISPPKLKLTISNYKNRTNNCITLDHQMVFVFIMNFQQYKDKISSICKEITQNQNQQYSFNFKNKKTIFVTFLHRIEYSGPCVRIIISDKNEDYLESEKVYMPIYEFLSLIMVMGQFRNNFLSIVDSSLALVGMQKTQESIKEFSDKLTGYYSELRGKSISLSATAGGPDPDELPFSWPKADDNYSPFDAQDGKSKPEPSVVKPEPKIVETKSEINEIAPNVPGQLKTESNFDGSQANTDLSDFIDLKRDEFVVDSDISESVVTREVPDTTAARVISDEFTQDFLKNNILNLEMYIINCVNDDLPFSKFIELIKTKLEFNPLSNIDKSEINSMDYLVSNYLKYNVKMNIEQQVKYPLSVAPIVFTNMKKTDNLLSLVYDLFLYSVYYSQVRNLLQDKSYDPSTNKEFVCFSLKSIVAPLAFSLIKDIDEDIAIAEIVNRYRRYTKNGVFSELIKDTNEKFSINLDIQEDSIRNEVKRIITAIKNNWDKLSIPVTFSKLNYLNLTIDDFKNNELTEEQIKKIISIEFNYRKNSIVKFSELQFKGVDDIPASIMKKFGVCEVKYDNTNLKRYIKEITKDDELTQKKYLQIADKINGSYRELKNTSIDFALIPESILKAIFLWDLDKDIKISQNYIYYLDMIKDSTLTKDMIISLLGNIEDVIDVDVVNSFIAARDE